MFLQSLRNDLMPFLKHLSLQTLQIFFSQWARCGSLSYWCVNDHDHQNMQNATFIITNRRVTFKFLIKTLQRLIICFSHPMIPPSSCLLELRDCHFMNLIFYQFNTIVLTITCAYTLQHLAVNVITFYKRKIFQLYSVVCS